MLRLLGVAWWLQLKMRSRSAFDGLLSLIYPLFFATTIFMMFAQGGAAGKALLSAAVGASALGIWSSVSTSAAFALQMERRQGTLELMVLSPRPFALLLVPLTLSMATIGAYSMIATLLWGRFVFGIHLDIASPLMFLSSVAMTVLAIAMLGALIAISSVRYRSAWALGAALQMPIWLISGFLVPLSALPAWVRPISWVLAPTWGMSGIHAAAEGRDAARDLVMCLLISIGYGVLGSIVARWMVRSARANATLALS
ncbi:ABC transporter permease [Longispora fulva]|uniref:ABC-2 type transport system permease protein n=1 Tax=Longispora fulva TaxID=619741 RepID=A0A8J7KUN7_9ACTN|nr:ABC transporter permease [Longispora fulva]MBG6134237.1 ABC-2 type transport system permease protein [Longispora fulva]